MNKKGQRLLIPFSPLFSKHQKQVLSLRFRKTLGRKLQNPPQSFYDKIFWMSMNSDTSKWSELADKYLVRDYVAQQCGDELLPELYGVYSTVDSVDFDKLPDSFVIKTNNGCGSNYIVRSKRNVKLGEIKLELSKALSFPYGELTGQLHYARIKPLVIAEELMFEKSSPNSILSDYKFYCFGGTPKYCYVVSDRVFDARHSHKRMMYDLDWNAHPEYFKVTTNLAYSDKPSCFERMVESAKELCADIPFVRVDLYAVNGRVKFGEMTFMPGMDPGFTEEFQLEMGKLIDLPHSE